MTSGNYTLTVEALEFKNKIYNRGRICVQKNG